MFDFHIPPAVENELRREVEEIVSRTGIYARIFSRIKTVSSIKHKFSIKEYNEQKKMQDLFGIRMVLYFKDDIDVCRELIQRSFSVVDISEDHDTATVFKPKRLNMVCELPPDIISLIDSKALEEHFIDTTFEIQLRTVFSEGWHEIEHDLRYKRKDEWNDDQIALRILNGIYSRSRP